MPLTKKRTERILKVTYRPEFIAKGESSDKRKKLYGTTVKPQLLICGFWLFQAGFEVGSKVKVSIKNGCLTIKPVTTSNQ